MDDTTRELLMRRKWERVAPGTRHVATLVEAAMTEVGWTARFSEQSAGATLATADWAHRRSSQEKGASPNGHDSELFERRHQGYLADLESIVACRNEDIVGVVDRTVLHLGRVHQVSRYIHNAVGLERGETRDPTQDQSYGWLDRMVTEILSFFEHVIEDFIMGVSLSRIRSIGGNARWKIDLTSRVFLGRNDSVQ